MDPELDLNAIDPDERVERMKEWTLNELMRTINVVYDKEYYSEVELRGR